MKRPILVLLAAAMLSLGLLGSSPAQAATSNSLTAAVTPAHDNGDDEHGHKYSHPHRQGGTRVHDGHHDHDHDGDHDGHDRRRRCSGLIVICLV